MKDITYTTFTEVQKKNTHVGSGMKVAGSVNAIAMNWVISENKRSKKNRGHWQPAKRCRQSSMYLFHPAAVRERKIKRNKTAERTGSIYISLTHLQTPAATQNRISTHFASRSFTNKCSAEVLLQLGKGVRSYYLPSATATPLLHDVFVWESCTATVMQRGLILACHIADAV